MEMWKRLGFLYFEISREKLLVRVGDGYMTEPFIILVCFPKSR